MVTLVKKWDLLPVEAKASIAYTIGNFLSKAMSIITLPVFAKMLTTSEMGISTLYSAWYTVFYTVITLSLCSGSLSVAMLEFPDKRDKYESACLTLSSLSTIVFFLAYLFLGIQVNSFTTLPTSLTLLIFVSVLFCPALDFWYVRQRFEYKYKYSVAVSCFITVFSAVVAILCVVYAKNQADVNLGIVRTMSSGFIPIIVSMFFYVYIMYKGKKFIDLSLWKYAIILSAPLIIHTLSRTVLDVSDRIMISSIVGKSETGIYGTIYSIALIPNIVWNSINNAIIPSTFEALKQNNYSKIDKMVLPLMLSFSGFSFFVSLLAPEVLKLLTTDEYVKYVNLVPAIIGGVYFTALYSVYGNFLLYKKKTVFIMFATVGAAGINIYLNYIFIHMIGFVASAYTTLVSFIVLAFFQGIMVRIAFKSKVVNDIKLFFLSLVTTGISLISLLLYGVTWLRYLIIIALIGIGLFFKNKIISFIKIKNGGSIV